MISHLLVWASVTTRWRMNTYRKLAALMASGVKTDDALADLEARARRRFEKSDPRIAVLGSWLGIMREGRSLSEAVARHATLTERMLIQAGETKDLPAAIDDLARLHSTMAQIRSKLRRAASAPLLYLLAVLGVYAFVARTVLPPFEQQLPLDQWTMPSAIRLAGLAHFVDDNLWLAAPALAALVALLAWAMPNLRTRLRVYLDRYPPFSLYRLQTGAAFLMSLSALLRAEVKIDTALDSLRINASPYLRERIDYARGYMREGKNLGEALQLSGHDFPDVDLVDDLALYAKANRLEHNIRNLSDVWLAQITERVDLAAGLVNKLGLGIVFLALLVLIDGIAGLNGQIRAVSNIG